MDKQTPTCVNIASAEIESDQFQCKQDLAFVTHDIVCFMEDIVGNDYNSQTQVICI